MFNKFYEHEPWSLLTLLLFVNSLEFQQEFGNEKVGCFRRLVVTLSWQKCEFVLMLYTYLLTSDTAFISNPVRAMEMLKNVNTQIISEFVKCLNFLINTLWIKKSPENSKLKWNLLKCLHKPEHRLNGIQKIRTGIPTRVDSRCSENLHFQASKVLQTLFCSETIGFSNYDKFHKLPRCFPTPLRRNCWQ